MRRELMSLVFRQMSRAGRQMFDKLRIFAHMNESTIRLENISTAYLQNNSERVTEKFSTVLSAGDFVCVLGVNGAGKSTLLRTIAGFQSAATGRVMLNNRDISLYSRRELAQYIGVVLTERQAFNTQMTVEELVALGRIPYTNFLGTLSLHDQSIVDSAMQKTGMAEMRSRKISTLSDGERQKAMIAKCIAQQTPVILLDEPTAFLDFPSKTETFRLLRHLAKSENKTVVVATHDLGTAFHTADILWVLNRGAKPVCGTPKQLAHSGTLDIFFKTEDVMFNRDTLTYTIVSENKI